MKSLYDTDYHKWLRQQRDLLAQRQFDQLDIENLLGELELGIKDHIRELVSHLVILLVHLLKYDYQNRVLKDPWVKDKVLYTWMPSINNPRGEIEIHVEENPSLSSHFEESLEKAYPKAKRRAIDELNEYISIKAKRLNKNSFPEQCPWSYEQVMQRGWLPEVDND
ncbi:MULTISPECIES: DUF29 domain-containing protein [unclassified Endozoicomonas]|uniref:DUF29 domain-containing protein n=1 Tax=unclassified Endozoicomonas TaxID=2644528 RepID=UPI002148650B|nr:MULTISPECIES: DUF29 domain-containing protein [unclassified Endozoicomonas]